MDILIMRLFYLQQYKKEFSNSLKIGFRFDILDELSIGTRNDEPILNDIFSRLVDDLDETKNKSFK